MPVSPEIVPSVAKAMAQLAGVVRSGTPQRRNRPKLRIGRSENWSPIFDWGAPK